MLKIFRKRSTVVDNPAWLGNLAVEQGYITADDLAQALQAETVQVRLGQVLVKQGKLTEEQLEDLLLMQRLRKGERVSTDELRRHERKKLRRRVNGLSNVFDGMGDEARSLTRSITGSMNGQLEKA